MYTFIIILLSIVCIFLVLIVLVQNSKGGGLASNFQASTQIMGARKTADMLEKGTWILSVALFVLCIGGSATIAKGKVQEKSVLEQKVQDTTVPTNQGEQFPTAAPKSTSTPAAAPASTPGSSATPAAAPASAPASGNSTPQTK